MNLFQKLAAGGSYVQRVSFPSNVTVIYNGAHWSGDDAGTADGHNLTRVGGRDTCFLSHARVSALMQAEELRVRPRNLADTGMATKKAQQTRNFEEYSVEQRLVADIKRHYVYQWEVHRGHNPTAASSKAAVKPACEFTRAYAEKAAAKLGLQAPKVKEVGRSTLYGWKAELTEAGSSAILVDRRSSNSGNWDPRLLMKQEQIIDLALMRWLNTNKHPMCFVLEGLQEDIKKKPELAHLIGVTFPSEKTLHRRKEALPNAQKDYLREGEEHFIKSYHSTGRGFDVPRPGTLLQIDGKILDVHTICSNLEEYRRLNRKQRKALETVRVTVVVVICVATRAILGFAVGLSESTKVTKKALRVAYSNKVDLARGVGADSDWPMYAAEGARIVSDNGSGTLEEFTSAAVNLHAFHQKATLGQPWLRSHIERFFRTLAHQFFPFFTALAFGPKGSKPTAPTIFTEMVPTLFTRFVVDRYNRRTHRGIGMSPYAAWVKMSEASPPPPRMDPDRLSAIFGQSMVVPGNPDGIEVAGLHYQSTELQKIIEHIGVGGDVTIKVDFENLGQISVQLPRGIVLGLSDEFDREDRLWISVPCRSGLKGVSVIEAEEVSDRLMEEYGATDEMSGRIASSALSHLSSISDRMKVELLYQEDVSIDRYHALRGRLHRGLTAAEKAVQPPEMKDISRSYPTGELAYKAPSTCDHPGPDKQRPNAAPDRRQVQAQASQNGAGPSAVTVHIPLDDE